MRRKILQITTSALLPFLACTNSAAADARQAYYVVSAPVTDLLLQISRDADMEIEFDSEQRVYVTSTMLSGTGTELIEQLTTAYDLSHFVFNGKSYLGVASDQQTRIIRSEDYEIAEMLAAIRKSGLELTGFPVTEIANPKAFVLTAPPRMIAIAETIVEAMPPRESIAKAKKIIVRRGVTIGEAKSE